MNITNNVYFKYREISSSFSEWKRVIKITLIERTEDSAESLVLRKQTRCKRLFSQTRLLAIYFRWLNKKEKSYCEISTRVIR